MARIVARTAQGRPYLPTEIHLIVSGFLEDDSRWDTLAVLSRSSSRLRSMYGPRLYLTTRHASNPRYCLYNGRKDPAPGSNHFIKALMWGIINESTPVMAHAKAYGADVNARVRLCHGKVSLTHYDTSPNNHLYGLGTMLQHVVQRGLDRSAKRLIIAGAVIITSGQASINMCQCATTGHGAQENHCSTLHLAFSKGHLGATRLIMDYLGPAVLLESQLYDQGLIILTAMRKAISTKNIRFLSTMLEYPSLRQLVNVVIPGGSHGARSTLVQQASLCASSRSGEFRDITGMDTILSALVRKGGASLGPYPASHGNERMSPLLEHSGGTSTKQPKIYCVSAAILTESTASLGVRPRRPRCNGSFTTNGRTDERTQNGSTAGSVITETLHTVTVFHYLPAGKGRRKPSRHFSAMGHRQCSRVASSTPPRSRTPSHTAFHFYLTHPVTTYKLLKLFLKHIKNAKITAAARKRAKTCMDRIRTDLRAERAVFTLSDWRVRARLRLAGHLIHHEKRDGPILLFWKGWFRGANGGWLVRSKD